MRVQFVTSLVAWACLLQGAKLEAQEKNIQTEIFTLTTCEPTLQSLIRDLSGSNGENDKPNKLEVRSRRPSVLQIKGINPLRYKYYLNNEAVTQFMDASPLTISLNNFGTGDFLISAPDIKVPEIFKTDSISTGVRKRVQQFQARSLALEDSIDDIDMKLQERWTSIFENTAELNKDKSYTEINKLASASFATDKASKSLEEQMKRRRVERDKNLHQYQNFTSTLPINNPKFAILQQYRDMNLSILTDDLDSIRRIQHTFGNEYYKHIERFKSIYSLLDYFSSRLYANYDSVEFKELSELLTYYSFSWVKNEGNLVSSNTSGVGDNVRNIRELILTKQFQLYEEFVVHIATQIGVLVQSRFREYSSFNNALESYTCIDSEILDSVSSSRDKLIKTFDFIQKTSAELQILVSYLDINTELYQSIAKKVNNNYLYLLAYLKNLDFISKHNTRQFSLPTHTNLKNVDLIRYTVKRDDKVTKNTQSYNYDFWIKGGLKIDFSIGFFGTRLTDNKYNKVLLDTAGGIDKIRITRQDDGRADFAFGGMVNIVGRNGARWLNLGGSIGVAYSGNQKLQILTGLGLHFGKTERIILHAGAAFGTIEYLDISASDFKFYDRDLKPVEREKLSDVKDRDRVYMLESPNVKYASYTIPTVNKFVIRPFIGISYNLSRKNALQAVTGAGVKTYADNLGAAQ